MQEIRGQGTTLKFAAEANIDKNIKDKAQQAKAKSGAACKRGATENPLLETPDSGNLGHTEIQHFLICTTHLNINGKL